MPSYADSFPVPRSPFSEDQGGPVRLCIGGKAEDVVESSLGMVVDWETQLRAAPTSVQLERFGWRAEDWTSAVGSQASPSDVPIVKLCLDSNVLISHLSLLKSIHQTLVSAFESGTTGFAFLVPATVLRELDGLKTSLLLADRRGGSTIGSLAQRAVAWLVDVKRMEREHGIGRGLLIGDELDMSSQHALEDNDGLILAAAMDTLRRSPEGTRVCLWTQDTNLQARAELQGLPTLPARGTPPTDPHAFLDSLGIRPSELGPFEVDMDAGPLSPPLARVSPPPPVRAIDSRLLATHTAQHRRPPLLPQKTGTLSCSHLPPFEAILLIMEIHFPPAIIRRLSAFERLAHAAYDEVGLPQLDDLRQMTITVPMCFQILELIWRHQEGGWRSSALIPRKRRRPKQDSPLITLERPPATLPPNSSRQLSMHARPPPALRSSSRSSLHKLPPERFIELVDADLLPPSAAHIRTQLLPALCDFCTQPCLDGMPDFLEALEAIFFGPGGRAFLGAAGWTDLAEGVERCWSHLSDLQAGVALLHD